MRLWTIQPEDVWHQVESGGRAIVDPNRISIYDYVPESYEWLVEQLVRRQNWTPHLLPWWCYCEKPDLRTFRHGSFLDEASAQVRLELEVSQARAFIMTCWAWEKVFCGKYLALTEAEDREWNERMLSSVPLEDDDPEWRSPQWPLPEPWLTELSASWERLFDPRLPVRGWGHYAFSGSEAVVQEIRRGDVRKVTEFVRVPRHRPFATP